MKTFELVLSAAPGSTDTLSLSFGLHDTNIAERYFEALRFYDRKRGVVAYPDRTMNFPGDPRDAAWIAARINECVDALNEYSPGLIAERAHAEMEQEELNVLHHHFEILRGPIAEPAPFSRAAPPRPQRALDLLNIYIHRFETYRRNQRALAAGWLPTPRAVVVFRSACRFPLVDDDYPLFTRNYTWGTWYIDYCAVGKPIWDLYTDRDEVVGDSAVIPLREYSANGMVSFGAALEAAALERQWARFYAWWDEKKALLDRLGFRKGDPKNAIGNIPVAEFDRSRAPFTGKSDAEVLSIIGRYPNIVGIDTSAAAPAAAAAS